MPEQARPAAAFVGLCVAWSTTFLPMKVGLDHGLPPLSFAAARVLLSALLLAPIVLLRSAEPALTIPQSRQLLPSAVMMVALSLGLIFWGEQYTTSGVPALVIATQPLVVILLLWALNRRRPSSLVLAAVLVGVLGVALVSSDRVAAPSGVGVLAVAAIVIGSSSYAAGGLYAERRLGDIPVLRLVFSQLLIGGSLLAAAALILEGDSAMAVVSDSTAVAAVAYLGLNTCIAFLLFLWLVDRIGAVGTSAYAFITPVTTLVLGALVYDEPVGPALVAGSVLILLALVLLWLGLSRNPAVGKAQGLSSPTS